MTEHTAMQIWLGLAAYAGVGVLVWLWLLAFALRRIDAEAHAAPVHVKSLWAPGMIGLWPLLVWRTFVNAPEDRG